MEEKEQQAPQKTDEKKDEGQPAKAKAGTSGEGSDNTSAGSGDRGGHRRRKGAPPDAEDKAG